MSGGLGFCSFLAFLHTPAYIGLRPGVFAGMNKEATMGAQNDWSVNDRFAPWTERERRMRRTECLADALRFQLDACREAEGLATIVVSDDLGFCVAHSGAQGEQAELAAQLPILVRPARANRGQDGTGSLDGRALAVTTFSAAGTTLHAAALPPPGDLTVAASVGAALERVASGFSRMLAQ
jgi:hypothetical protein